ncbi:MAG: hypothetical protein IT168_21475 [Bryobacterales bacterium]|nr:hypothetical protein [Bryobacterales bacterium]
MLSARLRFVPGIICCFSLYCTQVGFGQSIQTGSGARNLQLRVTQTEQPILYSRAPGGDFAVVLAHAAQSKTPIAATATLRGPDGTTRSVELAAPIYANPVAANGAWAFIPVAATDTTNRRGRAHLLNVMNGKRHNVSLPGVPVSAAISSDRLVVLSMRDSKSVLSSFDVDSGALQGETTCSAEPFFSTVSFGAPDRFLLIAWSEPSVAELTFANGSLAVGPSVRLRGDEVERSLASAHKQSSFTGSGYGREKIVLAHTTARNGNDLFFLGPFSRKEGFRLVEYGRDGRQVASHRLKEENLPPGKARIAQSLIATNLDSLDILRPDGVVISFSRP